MSIPDPLTLAEFAREVVRSHAQDIERMSVGEMMSGDPRFSEVTEGEFEDVEAAIYGKAKAYAGALSWPDDQPEFECEVCTQPITAYPCVLCEHEPDPWNRCGRLCTEMHTYEPGQCELAPQEAEQPQDDGNARVVAPMSDVRLERLAGLAELPCTCQDVDCGNYTSALTAQEARELVAEAKRARAALEARDAKAGA